MDFASNVSQDTTNSIIYVTHVTLPVQLAQIPPTA